MGAAWLGGKGSDSPGSPPRLRLLFPSDPVLASLSFLITCL